MLSIMFIIIITAIMFIITSMLSITIIMSIIEREFIMGTTSTRVSQPNDRSDPRLRIDAVLYGGQHGVGLQQSLIIFPGDLLLGLY
jgi:hypothetical protein